MIAHHGVVSSTLHASMFEPALVTQRAPHQAVVEMTSLLPSDRAGCRGNSLPFRLWDPLVMLDLGRWLNLLLVGFLDLFGFFQELPIPSSLPLVLSHVALSGAEEFIIFCALHDILQGIHTSHNSKPNVTRVQSATQWTASVHTLHMSKRNVTRVQSATPWTASVHTSHMSKPNVTRVQSATQWTASVHTLHMSKPNVTRVQSTTQWTASVHTLHMSKPNVTHVQSATQWTASVHTLHMSKPNVTRVQSATPWTASVLYTCPNLM